MSPLTADSLIRLFNQLAIPVQVVELQGDSRLILVAVNEASERAFGVGPAAVGLTLEEGFPALRGAGVAELCARVARSGEAASVDEVKLGGGARVAAVKASPLGEGRVGVTFEEPRAREKALEKELSDMQVVFQATINCVPDPVLVKSGEDGTLIAVNTAAAEAQRTTVAFAKGKRNSDLFTEEHARYLEDADAKVFAARETVSDVVESLPLADRRTLIFSTVKTPFYREDGRPLFLVVIARDITKHKEAERALDESRDELKETRANLLDTIRELSTPVLPIHDGVLVVPLIGHMDSQRSGQLTDALLSGIQRHRAEMVIIDTTGVEIVDTAVANHLIQATRAAALLGTECVLVGIAPSIARTLVQIGIDFGALTTQRDLQAGVAYALQQRGAREAYGDFA